MKKLLCFLTGILLSAGIANAQSQCITLTPANINPVVGATQVYNITFPNANLTATAKYALEYTFYLDGQEMTDAELAQHIDVSASSFTAPWNASTYIGSYINKAHSQFPGDPFAANQPIEDHTLNFFYGKYLSALTPSNNLAIKMTIRWLQDNGDYKISFKLHYMEDGVQDDYLYNRTAQSFMGGKNATTGAVVMYYDYTITKTADPIDTAVCYNALPVTIGDQTWTANDVFLDGGQDYPYCIKTVTYYSINGDICSNTPSIDSIGTVTLRRMPEINFSLNAIGNNMEICENSTAGYISLGISGGKAPYTITAKKNGQNFSTRTSEQASNAFRYDGLGIGIYEFTLTDDAGCIAKLSNIEIEQIIVEPEYTVSLTKTDISCHGETDGQITTAITSGTANTDYYTPLNYLWNNQETTTNLTDLSAGTYTLVVTDNRGCLATINPANGVTIVEPALITGTDQVTVCANQTPYNYKNKGTAWEENGDYDVTFTAANGCDSVVTVTFVVNPLPTAVLSGTTAICAGGDADLSIAFTGELPITATINNDNYTIEEASPYDFSVTPASTTDYQLTSFVDANNCAADLTNAGTVTITVNTNPTVNSITTPQNACPFSESFEVSANVTAGSSNDLTYHWTGATAGQTAGSAIVTEAAQGQCGYEYTVSVYVTDGNNCESDETEASFTVNDATNPTISPDYPESVEAEVEDECAFVIPDLTEMIGELANDNCGIASITQNPEAGTTLQAGSQAQPVTITVTDMCGHTATAEITVTVPSVFSAQVTLSESYCYNTADGKITVEMTGGTTPYTLVLNQEQEEETENTTYTFEDLPDGQYTIAITDANGCTIEPLSTTIAQISDNLVITADDNEKEYDGTALSDDGYTVVFGNDNLTGTANGVQLTNGDVVTAQISGSIANVGTATNTVGTVTVMRGNTDVTCYYNIVKNNGTLEVTASDDLEVTCPSGDNITKMYDGEALNPAATANVTSETTISYSTDGENWSATVPSLTNAGTQTIYVKAENSNYVTATCEYILTVEKRSISLTSATDQKVYDGTPLTNNQVTVEGDGWATGEGATYNVTGSQTDVGESNNTFTYTLNNNTLANNYDIETETGTLTVTPITTPITITAKSKEKKYDGTALTESGYTYTTGVLVTGDVLTAVVEGSVTHHADNTANNNVVTSYQVMRGNTNVTGNYTFNNPVPGTLTINKRNVTLTSATDTKVYDGSALTNDNIAVSGDDWASNEGATYNVTGTQTTVGTSNNTFTYTLNNNTTATDYNITTAEGTLTVTVSDELTITCPSGNAITKVYDGTPLQPAATASAIGNDVVTIEYSTNGVNGWSTTAPSITTVGTQSVYVKASNSNYNTKECNYILTVSARPITLTANSVEVEYDGNLHTYEETTTPYYTITSSTLAGNQTIDAITITGEGRIPGEYTTAITSGSVAIMAGQTDVTSNYNITLATGLLTITDREEPYEIEVVANSTTVTYDELSHSVSGFETLEFIIENNTYVVSGLSTSNPSATNAGTYPNTISGTAVVTDAFQNDVTDQFNITTTNGQLVIETAPMEVSCPSVDYTTKMYDGTALQPVATCEVTNGTTISYSTDGENWNTTAPSITHVNESGLNVSVKAENSNYVTATCEYELSIDPRSITLTSGTGSKVYDGTPLTNNMIVVTGDGFATGDSYTKNMTGTQTEVGESNNTFTYTLTGNMQEGDYEVTAAYGTLTVTESNALTVTCPSGSAITKVYDGTPLQPTATASAIGNDEITIEYSLNGENGWSTTVPSITTVGSQNVYVRASNSNYTTKECNYTLTVTSRPITLTANSTEVEYDGNLHNYTATTSPYYSITSGSLAYNQTIDAITITGEGRIPGTYTTAITSGSVSIKAGQTDVTSNYTISLQTGELTITDREEPYVINVYSAGDTLTYNGQQHCVTGLVANSFNVDGNTFTVSGLSTVDPCQYDAGAYPNTISGTAVVTDAYQNNVTGQFTVNTTNGQLLIEPATMEVTVTGGEWVYDGTAHSAEVSYEPEEDMTSIYYRTSTNDEWSQTEPSIINVGTMTVYVKVTNPNFNDAFGNATLTVTSRQIELTANSTTVDYDGEEHTYAETASPYYTITSGTLAGNEAITAITITGAGTNAGTYPTAITENSVVISSGQNNVTSNYTITRVNGSLTISPIDVTVTITGHTDTKTYNGELQTVEGYDVEIDNELYTEGDFTFSGTATASRRDVGSTGMNLTSNMFSNTNNNFETVTFNVTDGSITIESIEDEITITANSDQKVYDGSPLTNNGFTYTPDILVEGDVLVATVEGSITNYDADAADNNEVTAYRVMRGNDNVTDNYTFGDAVSGTLFINQRPITITSGTSSKVYDGTPLTNSNLTITGSFVGNDEITPSVTGTITNVGETDNTFTYIWASGNEDNYNITPVYGTLTITALDGVTVTVTGNHETVDYDGEEHAVDGFTIAASSNLYTVNDITLINNGNAHAEGTNAGTYNMNLVANQFSNHNNNFTNVTFTVAADGYLTIEPGTMEVSCPAEELCTKVYDGSALQPEAICDIEDGTIIYYSIDNQETWSTTAPAITHVADGPLAVYVKAENENYVTATCKYDLVIEPATVTLVSADLSKPYDGTALTNDDEPLATETGWIGNDGAEYNFTGSQTIVGSSANAFTYTVVSGQPTDYEINKTEGTLTVTALEGIVVTIYGYNNAESEDEITYDGEEHQISGYDVDIQLDGEEFDGYTAADFTFTGTASVSGTDAGSYDMGLTTNMFTNTNPNFDNVTFVVVDGLLTINPLEVEVMITGERDEFEYDGDEHTVSGFIATVTEEVEPAYNVNNVALAPNQTASVSRTDVGSSDMGLTADMFVNNDPNYEVTFNVNSDFDGRITITAKSVTVYITGNTSTVEYNGEEQNVSGYTAESSNDLYVATGDNVMFHFANTVSGNTPITETVTGTNVNTYNSAWTTANFVNDNTNFDVTFDISQAQLTITKAAVTVNITGNQVTETYDGEDHVAEGYQMAKVPTTSNYSLDYVSCTNNASVTRVNVGTSNMNLVPSQFTNNDNNYDVTFNVIEDGFVTVEAAEITIGITGHSDAVNYDGEEHTVSGYDINIPNDFEDLYTEGDITFSGNDVITETGVGTYYMGLTEDDFTNTNNNFNVTFEVTDGQLVISPAELTVYIIGNSSTVTYDGQQHSVSDFTFTAELDDEDFDGYTANDFTFNGNASITETDAGTYNMELSENMFTNINTNFSNVTFVIEEDGQLIINKLAVNVQISGNRDEFNYNGNEHTVEGFTAVAEEVIPAYDVTNVALAPNQTASVSRTEAGSTDMGLTADMFVNNDPNYDVTFVINSDFDGRITILPAEITIYIVGATVTETYDGEEHTASGYTATCESELYNEEYIEYSGDDFVTETEAGTYEMGLREEDFSYSDENISATFVVTDGSLTINPAEITVNITGNTAEYNYDEAEHTVSGYTFVALLDEEEFDDYTADDFTFNGTASVSGTNVGTYNTTWRRSNFSNENENYTVTFNIVSQAQLIINAALEANATTTDVLCRGGEANGTATISITGGKAPYTYAFTTGREGDGEVTDNELTISDFEAGEYALTITDALNYTVDVEFEISQPEYALNVSAEIITNDYCNGGAGEVELTISGGTEPYIVQWEEEDPVYVTDDDDFIFNIGDLADGTYSYTVTDANECEISNEVEVSMPNAVHVELNKIESMCAGAEEQLTATVQGGVLSEGNDYQFFWTDNEEEIVVEGNTFILSELEAGEHTISVTVFDDNECHNTATAVIMVNPNYDIVTEVRVGSNELYTIGGVSYPAGSDVMVHYVTSTGCDSLVTYQVRAFDLIIQLADTVKLTRSSYTTAYSLTPTKGVWPVDTNHVYANLDETKVFYAYFINPTSNTTWENDSLDMRYEIYYEGELINSVSDYMSNFRILSYYDKTGLYYGKDSVIDPQGEIPAHTMLYQLNLNSAVKFFDYYNYKAFINIPQQFQCTFTQAGTYTLKLILEKRSGGIKGTNWSGLYNPYIVNRRNGPLWGGHGSLPESQEPIASRSIDIVVGQSSAPTPEPTISGISNYGEMASMSLYPNPVNEQLNLRINGMEGQTSITITDAQGKVIRVINENLDGAETILTYEANTWAQGMYFVHVRNNGKTFSQKFIVNK